MSDKNSYALRSSYSSTDNNNHHEEVVSLDVSPKRLFGRDEDFKVLRQIITSLIVAVPKQDEEKVIVNYDDNIDKKNPSHLSLSPRRIVWVHGCSGCGKTVLCHAALTDVSVQQENIFYIEGKYNQLFTSTSQPYSAIIAAFDQLGGKLSQHYDDHLAAAMKECLKFEATILTKLVPSFAPLVTETDPPSSNNTTDNISSTTSAGENSSSSNNAAVLASERLAVAFRSFLREFTKQIGPIVFFIDDLQWADRYSRELIASIVQDADLYNFVLVGAFRDEKPELISTFLEMTTLVEDGDSITDISLHDLDISDVNAFLASALSSELESTLPLAELVHRKTNGNPFFMGLFLKQLHSQHFLTYNFATYTWQWDLEQVNAGTALSDNVVDVVTRRIQGIPKHVQHILRLAACLGYIVDIDLLQRLGLNLRWSPSSDNSEDDRSSKNSVRGLLLAEQIAQDQREVGLFEEALKCAEDEMFVERTGSTLKFSHDRIQQAVYNMVEIGGMQDFVHYQIGQYLKKCHEESDVAEESSKDLFIAVEQLNRGASLIKNEQGRSSLIRLNYEASRVSKKRAGTEAAALFLRKAIELTNDTDWLYHYEFTVELYNSATEVVFSLGMVEEASSLLNIIVSRAVREVDTVRARVVEFEMLGVLCQYNEAISLGCRLLRLLGESIPKRLSQFHVALEYFRARREARGKSDEFFVNLPAAASSKAHTIQRILRVGSVYGWNGDMNFAGFAMLRGFRCAIRDGASLSTPFLLSGYGFMLGLFNEVGEAYRFGKITLQAQRGKETFPSAATLTYTVLIHLQFPVSGALEPLLSAYRTGLETGDLFHGTVCIACYALTYFNCGLPLRPFAEDLRNFCDQLQICHQDLPMAWLLPSRQLALNLMGDSGDPKDLSFDAIERCQNEFFTRNLFAYDTASRIVPVVVLCTWYLQLYNAYILDDAPLAEATLKRILKLKPVSRRFGGSHLMNYFLPFLDGLVGLWFGTKSGSRVFKSAMTELSKLVKTRPVNCLSLVKLLKVVHSTAASSCTVAEARKGYDKVIAEFSRSGLNHFAAIAYELAGKNMLQKKEQYWGKVYLENAVRRWNEYNAFVKVQQLMDKYAAELDDLASELKIGATSQRFIQGRARFDVMTDTVGPKSTKQLRGVSMVSTESAV